MDTAIWKYIEVHERVPVTADNLREVRAWTAAADQRQFLRPGQTISHYSFRYEPGGQRGDLLVILNGPRTDEGMICLGGDGGDSLLGEWDAEAERLVVDDGETRIAYDVGRAGIVVRVETDRAEDE
jgi:hypothetical protein